MELAYFHGVTLAFASPVANELAEMKAVRGSNRAATKAPRKQNQNKSKRTTGKRAASDQVKCARVIFLGRYSHPSDTLRFSMSRSQKPVRMDGKPSRTEQRGQARSFLQHMCSLCISTLCCEIYLNVLGAGAQEGWQPIARSSIAEMENVMDLAILQVLKYISINDFRFTANRIQTDLCFSVKQSSCCFEKDREEGDPGASERYKKPVNSNNGWDLYKCLLDVLKIYCVFSWPPFVLKDVS